MWVSIKTRNSNVKKHLTFCLSMKNWYQTMQSSVFHQLWVCNLVTARFIWNILTGHCFFSPPNSLVSFISKTDGRNITNGHNITEILLTVRYHIHDQLETVFRIFVVVQDIFNKLKNQSRWFYGSGTIHVISSRISMSMV